MRLARQDLSAAVLMLLVLLAFTATAAGWGVLGDHHRLGALAVLVLGGGAMLAGLPPGGLRRRSFSGLGVVAVVLGALALLTGSLAALGLLVLDLVVLWITTLLRHEWPPADHRAAG